MLFPVGGYSLHSPSGKRVLNSTTLGVHHVGVVQGVGAEHLRQGFRRYDRSKIVGVRNSISRHVRISRLESVRAVEVWDA